jgi:hypothetical protein
MPAFFAEQLPEIRLREPKFGSAIFVAEIGKVCLSMILKRRFSGGAHD